jgi:hypothetical protein
VNCFVQQAMPAEKAIRKLIEHRFIADLWRLNGSRLIEKQSRWAMRTGSSGRYGNRGNGESITCTLH